MAEQGDARRGGEGGLYRHAVGAGLRVMPGLDQGIHDERQREKSYSSPPLTDHLMDCRVIQREDGASRLLPGNDGGEMRRLTLEPVAPVARQ